VDYTIRPATASDQRAITAMIRQARLNPMALHWQRFLLAEADDEIIGIVQVKPHGDGTRELASLAVLPVWQSRGVGTGLMQAVLARETGPLYLTCASPLEGYYTRFGFRTLTRDELTPYFRRLTAVARVLMSVARPFAGDLRLLVMRRDR
jgi:N-acetylglutamate synthase-like GNAT family acetyltransferase